MSNQAHDEFEDSGEAPDLSRKERGGYYDDDPPAERGCWARALAIVFGFFVLGVLVVWWLSTQTM